MHSLIISLHLLLYSFKTNRKGDMAGLYLIQVTFFICLIARFDGQALYKEKCVNEIDNEMQHLYRKLFGTKLYIYIL